MSKIKKMSKREKLEKLELVDQAVESFRELSVRASQGIDKKWFQDKAGLERWITRHGISKAVDNDLEFIAGCLSDIRNCYNW